MCEFSRTLVPEFQLHTDDGVIPQLGFMPCASSCGCLRNSFAGLDKQAWMPAIQQGYCRDLARSGPDHRRGDPGVLCGMIALVDLDGGMMRPLSSRVPRSVSRLA